jgi:hypothetical protein
MRQAARHGPAVVARARQRRGYGYGVPKSSSHMQDATPSETDLQADDQIG